MKSVFVSAPAKVNLALRVGARRPDGYHDLDTVFEAVDIFDDLQADLAPDLRLEISGLGENLPVDESNLVIKAAHLLQKVTNTQQGAHIKVHKRIPVAGGMAGGSADAAAALLALNTLWDLELPDSRLAELAGELGSDVPFALLGRIARGTSRGEQLVSIKPGTLHGWVFLTSATGLSTPEVFHCFDEMFPAAGDPPATTQLCQALTGSDLSAIAQEMVNDLAAPAAALRTDIADICAELAEFPGKTILSGSGPTIAIFCAAEAAESLAQEMQEKFPSRTALAAIGPVTGAHIRRVEK